MAGFPIDNHTCVSDQTLCSFRAVNGSILAIIGLLGVIFSSLVIYFLARHRIRLANCKSLLIINVAVSDAIVSLLGFIRGLGILDSSLVGAPADQATLSCVIYTICLNGFTNSGIPALLPLTVDRLVAVVFPLRHRFVITKKLCGIMFGLNWFPVLVSLTYSSIGFSLGSVDMEYSVRYHRCVAVGNYSRVEELEEICLLMVPFFLIILMYGVMLWFIVRNKLKCGRFLITASGIILTSLLSYSPSLIANIWNISLGYEISQILTVTLYYINGIVNPMIYVAIHPAAQSYVMRLLMKKKNSEHFPTSSRGMVESGEKNKTGKIMSADIS
ncbi:hypothetical protein ACHWQZ_G001975 [Mnemiopsis leidyi]